jgi:hypothetical protein
MDELHRVGIPKPTRVPAFMNLSTHLLTTDDEITVVSEKSSGEAEYVLLCQGKKMWVTIGSDHTDREVETQSIPASKQMCAKCLAPECWPCSELVDHWGRLILRCWATKGSKRTLYQEASLASVLTPREMLEKVPKELIEGKEGIAIFSGTIPTRGGLIYGDSYELEMEDPVLRRSLRYRYQARVLRQHG